MANCPLCRITGNANQVDYQGRWHVTCPGCGQFEIPVGIGEGLTDDERPRLSHAIRLRQQNNTFVEITKELASKLIEEPLPSLRQQMDGLLLFVGDRARLQDPVRAVRLQPPAFNEMVATIGAYNSGSLGLLLSDLAESGAVHWQGGSGEIRLLEPGWQRYEEIKTGTPYSRMAFMAMPFNAPRLEKVFRDYWQPAVARTGFELKTVVQRAGLIDDHIRVDIRKSRFLIAELTEGNRGAYWEAGFAEGLNKPVVYTCEKSYFDDPDTRPHFDVNHYSHVIWQEAKLAEAADELTTRIRASIPDAKLED